MNLISICASGHSLSSYVIGPIFFFRAGSYVSYLIFLKYDPTLSFVNIFNYVLVSPIKVAQMFIGLYYSSSLFFFFFFFFFSWKTMNIVLIGQTNTCSKTSMNSLDIMRQTACMPSYQPNYCWWLCVTL